MSTQTTWFRLALMLILFFLLWVGAWLLHDHIATPTLHLVAGSTEDTLYWLIAKLLVWIAFPILFFSQPLRQQIILIGLNPKNMYRGLIFGIVAAALWLALSAARFLLTGQHLALTTSFFIAFYTVVLTPIVEEIVFRGYIQSTLIALKTNFFLADIITTFLFLVPHVIGWSFQGVLSVNLTIGGIGAIALLSLLLGFVRYQSRSLVGSVLLHVINNLVSIFVH